MKKRKKQNAANNGATLLESIDRLIMISSNRSIWYGYYSTTKTTLFPYKIILSNK